MSEFWERVEGTRIALNAHGELSRAELARRANIAVSTIDKGLSRRSRPNGAVRRQIERVLEEEQARQQGEAA